MAPYLAATLAAKMVEIGKIKRYLHKLGKNRILKKKKTSLPHRKKMDFIFDFYGQKLV